MRNRPVRLRLVVSAATALTAASALMPLDVQAQAFPSRPLRLVLPFPPGGPTDMLGRALAARLGEQVGQPVTVDNRPGAGGNLGLELTSRASPDGYTMVLSSPLISISPSLYSKLNYDPFKDLSPVSLVAVIQNILVVHPSVPARTLPEPVLNEARGRSLRVQRRLPWLIPTGIAALLLLMTLGGWLLWRALGA